MPQYDLEAAILKGESEQIKEWLKNPEHETAQLINGLSSSKKSPLYIAAEKGFNEVVKLLLSHPYLRINHECHPLYVACGMGHTDVVESLLAHQKINVNYQRRFRNSPLYIAIRNGHAKVVEQLLEHPRLNINPEDYGPLHEACSSGYTGVAEVLLKHPDIDVNKQIGGKTPLRIAIQRHYLKTIQLLLSHPKIDLNFKGISVSLSGASQYERASMVAILFLYGADSNLVIVQNDRLIFQIKNCLCNIFQRAFSKYIFDPWDLRMFQVLAYLMKQHTFLHALDSSVSIKERLPSVAKVLDQLKKEEEMIQDLSHCCNVKEEVVTAILVAYKANYFQLKLFWEKCLNHDWRNLFPLEEAPPTLFRRAKRQIIAKVLRF